MRQFRIVALTVAVAFALGALWMQVPTVVKLWPDIPPNALGTGELHEPTLQAFQPWPGLRTTTGVVVVPGGGYAQLMSSFEGRDVARWLSRHGITAFVLHYRYSAGGYQHPVPLMDAERAIEVVRRDASSWGLDPDKIGMIGFSAGGHLAALTATRGKHRPNFLVLGYPVISMWGPATTLGTREALLGIEPDQALCESVSPERHVSASSPPTFLVHAIDDSWVSVDNSRAFHAALQNVDVSSTLHELPVGGHAFGLGQGQLGQGQPDIEGWPEVCLAWLREQGF